MNQIVFAAGVLLFPAVCTTLGAAGVFLLRRSAAPRTQRVPVSYTHLTLPTILRV